MAQDHDLQRAVLAELAWEPSTIADVINDITVS